MGAKIHWSIVLYNEYKFTNIFALVGNAKKILKTKTKVYKVNAL
jgi:hypothetical protein